MIHFRLIPFSVQDIIENLVDDPCAGRPMCMKFCGSGFVKDEEGCDTCECNPGKMGAFFFFFFFFFVFVFVLYKHMCILRDQFVRARRPSKPIPHPLSLNALYQNAICNGFH